MAVVHIDISKVRTVSYNPRTINPQDLRELKASIIQDPSFMEVRPLLINLSEGIHYVYAGTQRYFACLELGWKKVPCIIDTDLSEELQKKRMVKDNSHNGQWDLAKLKELDLTELEGMKITELFKELEDRAENTVRQKRYIYKVALDSKEEKDMLIGAIFTAKQQSGYTSTEDLFLNR